MPEFLQRRYGSVARGMFAGLILLIYVFVEIAAVLYFGALALNALIGVSVHVCVPDHRGVTASTRSRADSGRSFGPKCSSWPSSSVGASS